MQKSNDSTKSIVIKCEGAATQPLDRLTVLQGGLKKLSKKNLERLKKRITTDGFCAPIFIWDRAGELMILDGTQRRAALMALESEGWTVPPLPVVYIHAEDEAAARRILLSISSQYGEWVEEELAAWLDGVDAEIRETLRLVDKELQFSPKATDDDDEVTEVEESTTKEGDVWELGKHRLVCGESEKVETFQRLLGDERIDLMFTDPPYGVAIGDKNKLLDTIQKAGRVKTNIENDTLSPEALKEMLVTCFTLAKQFSQDACSYYVTAPQGGELGMMMMMMMGEAGLPVRHIIIWVKDRQCFSFGRLDYEYKHEPILYTWNKKHVFIGGGQIKSSVWTIDKELKCDVHPTMKPVALVENAILNSSEPGQIVADIFCGSGTTIIAAERTGRICRAIEKDPHYCDVIIERYRKWCETNDRKAIIKLNGSPWTP